MRLTKKNCSYWYRLSSYFGLSCMGSKFISCYEQRSAKF